MADILGSITTTPISFNAINENITDQTYNPESKNAQSGVAVTEALGQVASAIKVTKDGTVISAKDVSPIEHNVDVKVDRKNLLPTPYDFGEETTVNGVTFTTNADGSITINGTPTGPIDLVISNNKAVLETGATYCYSVQEKLPQGEQGNTTVQIFVEHLKNDGVSHMAGYINGDTTSIVYADSKNITTSVKLKIQINYSSYMPNEEINGTIKPMIEKGEAATEYVPYNLSNVTVSRCGKNLLAYPYDSTPKYINHPVGAAGINFTDNGDGTITANGTATARAQFLIYSSEKPRVLKKGTYFLSGVPEGASSNGYSFYFSVGRTYEEGKAFTLTKDTEIYLNISIEKGVTVNNLVFKPQLEVGSIATEYEPYTKTDYTPNADGTVEGVKSISPYMTLVADVPMTMAYNADTKMYIDNKFNELATALINS